MLDSCADDIQSSDDNEEFADFLLDQLRQFTENPDVHLTFSISGGRKTMSAIGALCLSLLGRKEDKMCHVLVNSPFDRNDLQPHFFFPGQRQCHLLPDGSVHDSSNALITLGEIPYVHQRYIFGERVTNPGSYRNLVASANGILQAPSSNILAVCPRLSQLSFGRVKLKLPFQEFLLYYFLIMRRIKDLPALRGTTSLYEYLYDDISSWPEDSLNDKFSDCHGEIIEKLNKLKADDLRKIISAIANRFRRVQIPINSGIYPAGQRGEYGLNIDKEKIQISTK